jgi:uncharacterized membrane protein
MSTPLQTVTNNPGPNYAQMMARGQRWFYCNSESPVIVAPGRLEVIVTLNFGHSVSLGAYTHHSHTVPCIGMQIDVNKWA